MKRPWTCVHPKTVACIIKQVYNTATVCPVIIFYFVRLFSIEYTIYILPPMLCRVGYCIWHLETTRSCGFRQRLYFKRVTSFLTLRITHSPIPFLVHETFFKCWENIDRYSWKINFWRSVVFLNYKNKYKPTLEIVTNNAVRPKWSLWEHRTYTCINVW